MDLKLKIDIENLSPVKKNLLIALPSVVIAVLSVMFFIMPAFEEKGKLSAEVAQQNSDIKAAQQKTARLSKLIAENEKLRNRLFELQLQLPEEKEVSGLLKQVSELGIKSGLQIVSWKPKEKAVHSSREVYEIPVDVEMHGNYHRFGQFFSNINKLSRVVNIANINMRPVEQKQRKNGAGLSVSFTGMTYSLIPEKERKEIEKAEKEKKEKKK